MYQHSLYYIDSLDRVSFNNWLAARVSRDLEFYKNMSADYIAFHFGSKEGKIPTGNQPRSAPENMAHQHNIP